MKHILLIQGANLRWLGKRQPEFYGTTTAKELDARAAAHAAAHGYKLTIALEAMLKVLDGR